MCVVVIYICNNTFGQIGSYVLLSFQKNTAFLPPAILVCWYVVYAHLPTMSIGKLDFLGRNFFETAAFACKKKRRQFYLPALLLYRLLSFYYHCCATCSDHQHSPAFTKHFIINVHAYHCIGSHGPGALLHFS